MGNLYVAPDFESPFITFLAPAVNVNTDYDNAGGIAKWTSYVQPAIRGEQLHSTLLVSEWLPTRVGSSIRYIVEAALAKSKLYREHHIYTQIQGNGGMTYQTTLRVGPIDQVSPKNEHLFNSTLRDARNHCSEMYAILLGHTHDSTYDAYRMLLE